MYIKANLQQVANDSKGLITYLMVDFEGSIKNMKYFQKKLCWVKKIVLILPPENWQSGRMRQS